MSRFAYGVWRKPPWSLIRACEGALPFQYFQAFSCWSEESGSWELELELELSYGASKVFNHIPVAIESSRIETRL